MLWSLIIYGHRAASILPNTYDSTAPTILQFFWHRTVPGEVKVLLKNLRRPCGILKGHWGLSDIGREPYSRPAFPHIGRAPDDFFRHKSSDFNGDRPGSVWGPAGHRTISEERQELSKILNKIDRCLLFHPCQSAWHRILSNTDAGRRPYDLWPLKESNVKNRPVLGLLLKFAVDLQSPKSYGCSFICDFS